jgi:hypothetical protein
MIGSSCNEKNCPGWIPTLAAGLLMVLIVLFSALSEAIAGEVRVEITRELPDETQHIVQQFHDEDSFQMWMGDKMESEGCDPYVSEIRIFRNYQPKEQ